MVSYGIASFKDKKVLMLQSPVGPFFKRLGKDLEKVGAEVSKINLNGGDWFFSDKGAINFTGKPEEWGVFFASFIKNQKIDRLLLFGDCREYHRIAHTLAHAQGIEIGVFEEGYVRPDYITFERFGVNGFSLLPRNRAFYDQLNDDKVTISPTIPIGNSFYAMAWWAFLYYFFSALLFPMFRFYRHHRPLNPWEIMYWIRSFWRKQWYKVAERTREQTLITQESKNYFLVPLQISTDAQVCAHSPYHSVEDFIHSVIASFAEKASNERILVIKHHPLDRGYHNYKTVITKVAFQHGITQRCWYIHDQHLPTLLDHALGVVVINSTVGLSALHHHVPLKVCGTAIYDMEGLTYQGSLDTFWDEAPLYAMDKELFKIFRGYIINDKQINGNFYRRLEGIGTFSGLKW